MNNEKIKNIWLHTQNPRRFPGFTVVEVTFFVEIINDSHDVFRNVSLSQRKSTTRFVGGHSFSEEKVAIVSGRGTKTHILPPKINEHKFAKVSPSGDNHSFRIINH